LLIWHSKYRAILSKILFYRLLFGDFAHWEHDNLNIFYTFSISLKN